MQHQVRCAVCTKDQLPFRLRNAHGVFIYFQPTQDHGCFSASGDTSARIVGGQGRQWSRAAELIKLVGAPRRGLIFLTQKMLRRPPKGRPPTGDRPRAAAQKRPRMWRMYKKLWKTWVILKSQRSPKTSHSPSSLFWAPAVGAQ